MSAENKHHATEMSNCGQQTTCDTQNFSEEICPLERITGENEIDLVYERQK